MNDCAKRTSRRGSSMVEVVVATLISGVVIVGALNVMGGAIKTRTATIAYVDGPLLANELLTEIMSKSYEDPEASGTGELGREPGETTRSTFDDVDDYFPYTEAPPLDIIEQPLTAYAGWTRSVQGWYISPDNGSSHPFPTGLKAISVQVTSPGGTMTERIGYRWQEGTLEQPTAIDSEVVTWVGAELQIGALGVARAGTNLINAATD